MLFDHHQQTLQLTKETVAQPGLNYPVKQYADIVHLQGAEALAVYEEDFYAGSPAVTVNQFGRGQAYYLAARYDDDFLADFYGWLGRTIGLETASTQPLPLGVTVQVRATATEKFIFLLNFESKPQSIRVDDPATVDALSGQAVNGEVLLDGYSLRILRKTNGS